MKQATCHTIEKGSKDGFSPASGVRNVNGILSEVFFHFWNRILEVPVSFLLSINTICLTSQCVTQFSVRPLSPNNMVYFLKGPKNLFFQSAFYYEDEIQHEHIIFCETEQFWSFHMKNSLVFCFV